MLTLFVVRFTPQQKQITKELGQRLGLDVVSIVSEPVAAAMYVLYKQVGATNPEARAKAIRDLQTTLILLFGTLDVEVSVLFTFVS